MEELLKDLKKLALREADYLAVNKRISAFEPDKRKARKFHLLFLQYEKILKKSNLLLSKRINVYLNISKPLNKKMFLKADKKYIGSAKK